MEEWFYIQVDLIDGSWMTKAFIGPNSEQKALDCYRDLRTFKAITIVDLRKRHFY